MKRNVYDLKWDKHHKVWVTVHRLSRQTTIWHGGNKKQSIWAAARHVRREWAESGLPSQLVVHNKNGRIAFERTYGKDPKRRKG